MLLPPMLMPQLHVNVGEHSGKPINCRIIEALCSSMQPVRRIGKGDPLVTTHELCVATDKALRYCIPGSSRDEARRAAEQTSSPEKASTQPSQRWVWLQTLVAHSGPEGDLNFGDA